MSKSKSVDSKLNQLQLDLEEITEKHKRALADYQNQKKRFDQEKIQYIKLANSDIIHKFLGILDHLQQAASHLNDQGLDMVIQEFHHLLESEGVTPIEATGQSFDPDIMECVDQVPGEKDQVISVTQTGYQLDTRLIRPAKVTVGNGKKQ